MGRDLNRHLGKGGHRWPDGVEVVQGNIKSNSDRIPQHIPGQVKTEVNGHTQAPEGAFHSCWGV